MQVPTNWEKVAELQAKIITDTPQWREFCDKLACQLEDNLRERLMDEWAHPASKNFKFGNSDEDCENEMEFSLTLEGDLAQAFFKYLIDDYLGIGTVRGRR